MLKKVFYTLICLTYILGADQGITSPTHAKNVKKLVFSKEPIDFRHPNASKFQDSFNIKDSIYGRIYLEKSLSNTDIYNGSHKSNGTTTYRIVSYIDGKRINLEFDYFDEHKLTYEAGTQWTSWRFSPSVKNPQDSSQKFNAKLFTKLTKNLTPAKHKITFEFYAVKGQFISKSPIASGSFYLNIKKGESIGSANTMPMSKYTGSNENSLKNAVKKIIKITFSSYASTPMAVVITSNWSTHLYRNGKKYRKISAVVAWDHLAGQSLCKYTNYQLKEDLNHNNWGELQYLSMGSSEDINCNNIK